MEQRQEIKSPITLVGLLQASSALLICCSCLAVINQVSYPTELLSHFRLQYFWSGLLFGLYFYFRKKRNWAIAMLCACILNTCFILPIYWGGNQENTANSKDRIKLLLCNVNTHNQSYSMVIELIQEENPNIIILQEVSRQWIAALQPIEEKWPCLVSVPQSDNFGMAIYSNVTGAVAEKVQFGQLDIPSIVMSCKSLGKELTIIATHPLPPINAYYYQMRNQQLMSVAEEINQRKTPIALLGDLNTSMWSADFHKLTSSSGLINARKGLGILPSWPAPLGVFGIPLDHCLVSTDVRVTHMKIGPPIGSDHLPVIIELQL